MKLCRVLLFVCVCWCECECSSDIDGKRICSTHASLLLSSSHTCRKCKACLADVYVSVCVCDFVRVHVIGSDFGLCERYQISVDNRVHKNKSIKQKLRQAACLIWQRSFHTFVFLAKACICFHVHLTSWMGRLWFKPLGKSVAAAELYVCDRSRFGKLIKYLFPHMLEKVCSVHVMLLFSIIFNKSSVTWRTVPAVAAADGRW